jgi:uncharacterized phage protein (TIGR01671 family)
VERVREIKCRAWDTDNKKMITPSGRQALVACCSVIEHLENQPVSGGLYQTKIIRSFNGVLLEYTGLKDKNGKEIYDGDVVKIHNLQTEWKHGEPEIDWRILAVEWNQYTWAFNNSVCYRPLSNYDLKTLEDYDIEIIGNVHENPELLDPQPR